MQIANSKVKAISVRLRILINLILKSPLKF
jgi:hypothetical protein